MHVQMCIRDSACTGLATIGAAQELEDVTGLPVIDPVMAEGLFAYYESIR